MRIPLLLLAAAGCGVAQTPAGRPKGADPVIQDQTMTGGHPVSYMPVPTFDEAFEKQEHVRFVELGAQRDQRAAVHDRAAAAQLAYAETEACRGIPEREREHSLFAHRKAIASIEPLREAGQLHGVRVTFRPVRGLTAKFVRSDIACARARWATFGRDPQLMPYDPTLVDGADVEVQERDGRVEVVVRTSSSDAAQVALARANHELTAEK